MAWIEVRAWHVSRCLLELFLSAGTTSASAMLRIDVKSCPRLRPRFHVARPRRRHDLALKHFGLTSTQRGHRGADQAGRSPSCASATAAICRSSATSSPGHPACRSSACRSFACRSPVAASQPACDVARAQPACDVVRAQPACCERDTQIACCERDTQIACCERDTQPACCERVASGWLRRRKRTTRHRGGAAL
jgi:hypothetical protein